MRDPLPWLPCASSDPGECQTGVEHAVARPGGGVPDGVDRVELYCLPTGGTELDLAILERMPRLRVLQTLSAGLDRVRPRVPAGVVRCNGRGVHDAATAELALTLLLTSLRRLPELAAARSRQGWA